MKAIDTDQEFRVHKFKVIDTYDDKFVVELDDGFSMEVRNENKLPFPDSGTARVYCKGLGYPVRGFVVDGNVYFYETETEYIERERKLIEENGARKKKDWEENLSSFYARLTKLPVPFQLRIMFFLKNTDWGWRYGPYEMFCCEEAVKIAAYCRTVDAVQAFSSKSYEEQCKIVSDQHSGNTFGHACALAFVYLSNHELVPKMHGGLCPMVGCMQYGCWSMTNSEDGIRRMDNEAKQVKMKKKLSSWIEIDSYGASEKKGPPRTFQLQNDLRLQIGLTRLVHGDPSCWYLNCPAAGFVTFKLEKQDLEAAKKEALWLVHDALTNYITMLEEQMGE